jgi:hypothetical protein
MFGKMSIVPWICAGAPGKEKSFCVSIVINAEERQFGFVYFTNKFPLLSLCRSRRHPSPSTSEIPLFLECFFKKSRQIAM